MIPETPSEQVWRDRSELPWMVALPAGAFVMGESQGDKFANHTERPAHRVNVAAFALGRFPVTVSEYRVFRSEHAPEDNGELPVVNVTWEEAQSYCQWLGKQTGRQYRLPSEAEWEYACRAGSRDLFSFGSDIDAEKANYFYTESGERIGQGGRTPWGTYPANAFGLYDLHGNVCEWMEDHWHADYVGAPADCSPWLAAESSERRVVRGGAWDYLPRLLRSAWRDGLDARKQRDNVGFRVATSYVYA